MRRRQSLPEQWLITDPRIGHRLLAEVRRLPVGSGIILRHHHLPRGERARLLASVRRIARARRLLVVEEGAGGAARVHDAREIVRARLGGAAILLLSPLFQTRTHPGAPALPRMRAAALARLAGLPLLALGGVDERRFRKVKALGFEGWAGIDAWLEREA
jgi:thiamine-phosphate pyrophosphorylase